jgi:SAM domain (Sterile alpha motif)
MDIVVWLRSLGLGKYEAAFRENDIDETVLPSLTHENLKELGVSSLGHRVKLLDAIAVLRNDASASGPSGDLKTAAAAQSDADRRRSHQSGQGGGARRAGRFDRRGWHFRWDFSHRHPCGSAGRSLSARPPGDATFGIIRSGVRDKLPLCGRNAPSGHGVVLLALFMGIRHTRFIAVSACDLSRLSKASDQRGDRPNGVVAIVDIA